MTTGGPPSNELVEAIAAAPGVAERLLAVHTDDGNGRCRVCTNGPQAGRQIHPCRLYEIAEQASTLTPGGLIFTSPDEGGDPVTGRMLRRRVVDGVRAERWGKS